MTSPGPWTPGQQPVGNSVPPLGDPPYVGGPHAYAGGPHGEQPKSKGGWLTWVVVVVAVLFLVGMCAVLVGDDDEAATEAPFTTGEPAAPVAPAADPDPLTESGQEPVSAPDAAPAPESEADVPREFQNAVRSANQYLNYTSFSRQGLIDQLLFENYSHEAAQFAVDTVDADWNEQAAKKAQEYLDFSSFSQQGLVDQLIFEGFTPEQAEFGVGQVY